MKAWALAAGLVLAPAAASAGTLIAGATRDTDGFVVAGATVVARDVDGRIVGRGTTAADGTFAIDADGAAAALDVSCRFCVAQHVVLGTEPPAIVVVRYAALRDRTPSSDDIAALPYDRIAQIAALVPYTVATDYGISDRGLGAGNGATTFDGISYYRISDGRDFLNLIPFGSVMSLGVQPAALAPLYGQPAQGGLYDAATLGSSAATLRGGGDGGGAILDASGTAAVAESLDGNVIRRATGRLDAPLAGGTVSLSASAASNGADAATGTALRFALPLRTVDALASLSAADSRSASDGGAIGTDVRADAHLHGHGASAWDAGVRLQTASAAGPGSVTGVQGESALYADAQRTVASTSVRAALALQSDVESAGPGRWQTTSVLPSVGVEQQLGGGFTLHASTTAAIRDPYLAAFGGYGYVYEAPSAFSRTDVVDAGLSYTDERRLRVDGMAYAQRAGDAPDHINGLGLDVVWQATPQLAIRSWALAADAGADLTLAPAALYGGPPAATALRREVLWITYSNGVRIDLLDRGAGFDGSLSLPLGHTFTLVAGTFGRLPGRVVTVDLRAHP